jgi:hypothetical protein
LLGKKPLDLIGNDLPIQFASISSDSAGLSQRAHGILRNFGLGNAEYEFSLSAS